MTAAITPGGLFAEGKVYLGETEMVCPTCGNVYTHPIGACTRIGRDENEAGVYLGTEAVGVTVHRRSALVAMFRCESGHRFALVVQQHKGINCCSVEQLYPRARDGDREAGGAPAGTEARSTQPR